MHITPYSEVDFVEQGAKVYLIRKSEPTSLKNPFKILRGRTTVKMSTDEIMALTRGKA